MARRHCRYEVDFEVRLSGGNVAAEASNISRGGVFVKTLTPSELGQTVTVELQIPGHLAGRVPVIAEVKFVITPREAANQKRMPGMGVEFVQMDPAARSVIDAFLDSLGNSRKGVVLLVEDDPDVAELHAAYLRRSGYTTVRASNGVHALEVLEYADVWAVVSDVEMPGMDGSALLAGLREKGHRLPVVFVTGSENQEMLETLLEQGARTVLSKPIRRRDLADALARIDADPPPAVDS